MQLDFVTNESQLIFKKKYGKIIDETGEPTIFQTSPDTTIDEQNVTPCEVAENVLILWPLGQVLVTKLGLEQLDRQCYLRQREWQVYENAIRKRLIFQIRRLQRNKCTHWKEGARRKSTIYDV